MDAPGMLRRLRDDPKQVEAFVRLALDQVLDRPVSELVEPGWLAHAIADGIRASARSDDLEAWVCARLVETLEQADELRGPLADRIPVTVMAPIETALGREFVFDPGLVRAMIDHPSVHTLIRDVLQSNILEFGRKMRNLVPDVRDRVPLPKSGMLGSLAGMAKGVADAVGSEATRQLEPRVSTFVDGALQAAVDMCVARLCDPEHADELASWRVDMFHSLLQQPIETLVAERHKYPPADLAADASALLRALAGWKQLTEVLEDGLRQIMERDDQQSARSWLEGSGLEDAWRPALEEGLAREASAIVESEAFEVWWNALADASPSE